MEHSFKDKSQELEEDFDPEWMPVPTPYMIECIKDDIKNLRNELKSIFVIINAIKDEVNVLGIAHNMIQDYHKILKDREYIRNETITPEITEIVKEKEPTTPTLKKKSVCFGKRK